MADDAGALLVRSGLVSPSSLAEARAAVQAQGGTIGEQLVATGAIEDDELTEFYRARLLVPQVNPNMLARLPTRVIATIPGDMAIELRAIPVALDADNNLTVAMSDPSDRHAVDEIAFFTGAYVVRAVATQMQIAWCLVHYYGHVTALGQRLLEPADEDSVSAQQPEAPGEPDDAPRPPSDELDATMRTAQPDDAVPEDTADAAQTQLPGAPGKARGRSISGEIGRAARRGAPSTEPPSYDRPAQDASASGAVLAIVTDEPENQETGPAMRPPPRREVRSDPPELAARAGEVDIATGPVRKIDLHEVPRIIVDEDELAPPPKADATGEIQVRTHRNDSEPPVPTIEITDDRDSAVVIRGRLDPPSAPVLLERRRPTPQRAPTDQPTGRHNRAQRRTRPGAAPRDERSDVVVLDARKPDKPPRARTAKNTQVGTGVTSALTRGARGATASGVPGAVDDGPTTDARTPVDPDPTRLDARPAPRRSTRGDDTDETLAPPPRPGAGRRLDDSGERLAAPPRPARPRGISESPHAGDGVVAGGDEDDDEMAGPTTTVMSAVELDDAIPERTADVVPAHIAERERTERGVDHDPIDDGWGPPGSTIPPALLGAIPGSDDPDSIGIPVANVDSAPLIVGPPTSPEPASRATTSGGAFHVTKLLEEATARVFELIRDLETARDRDQVVALMVAHLADSHQRAGFFSIKPDARKVNALSVFTMRPSPAVLPKSALRLDRPSTLQDVVGTRLPYRGPTHDEASRIFLTSVLGACPPEILLVPVAVRERVVGVLFGEKRMRHTFDDQLALVARAAGIALERILKAKRG